MAQRQHSLVLTARCNQTPILAAVGSSYRLHLSFSTSAALELTPMSQVAKQISPRRAKTPRNTKFVVLRRMREGNRIAKRLLAIPNASPAVLAAAHLIHKAAQPQNHWVAKNLRTQDGHVYEGLGAFWLAGIRLCPTYQAAASRRARKRVREALKRVPIQLGERLRFLTLTAPTIPGIGLEATLALFNSAFRRFYKSQWFTDHVSAGVKGMEFTLGNPNRLIEENRTWDFDQDGYHVHIHAVLIGKWIDWEEVGNLWTNCFLQAANERSIEVPINTSHGRLIIHVLDVTDRKAERNTISVDALLRKFASTSPRDRTG